MEEKVRFTPDLNMGRDLPRTAGLIGPLATTRADMSHKQAYQPLM
jgi:hypothetical protein